MDDISDPNYARELGILADAMMKHFAHNPAIICCWLQQRNRERIYVVFSPIGASDYFVSITMTRPQAVKTILPTAYGR